MTGANGSAASVLIVDDSSTFRTAFRSYLLDQSACEVAEAPSGEAAVKMCRELSPKIVFMDLRMPGIGGLEACRQIRAASADTRLERSSSAASKTPRPCTRFAPSVHRRIPTSARVASPGPLAS